MNGAHHPEAAAQQEVFDGGKLTNEGKLFTPARGGGGKMGGPLQTGGEVPHCVNRPLASSS